MPRACGTAATAIVATNTTETEAAQAGHKTLRMSANSRTGFGAAEVGEDRFTFMWVRFQMGCALGRRGRATFAAPFTKQENIPEGARHIGGRD